MKPERQFEIAKECGARRENHPDLAELFVLNFWPEELNAYTSRVIAEATAEKDAEIAALKQRVEDSQKQEPRYGLSKLGACPAYSAPVIPPEVAELQAKLTKVEQNVKELADLLQYACSVATVRKEG